MLRLLLLEVLALLLMPSVVGILLIQWRLFVLQVIIVTRGKRLDFATQIMPLLLLDTLKHSTVFVALRLWIGTFMLATEHSPSSNLMIAFLLFLFTEAIEGSFQRNLTNSIHIRLVELALARVLVSQLIFRGHQQMLEILNMLQLSNVLFSRFLVILTQNL